MQTETQQQERIQALLNGLRARQEVAVELAVEASETHVSISVGRFEVRIDVDTMARELAKRTVLDSDFFLAQLTDAQANAFRAAREEEEWLWEEACACGVECTLEEHSLDLSDMAESIVAYWYYN
jgi:hypothetical protein